jgi:TolB protein
MGAVYRWVRIGGMAALLLLLAGCSPSAMREQVGRLVFRQPAAPVVTTPPGDPSSRILIQGEDGNLYIASLEEEGRFALTDDASRRRLYGQATWSPDGSRVAWSELGSEGSRLVTSRFDGSERHVLDVPYLPFYIAWNPKGDQLAYLSNWQAIDGPSMALRLVDLLDSGNSAVTLASGQPFYFSWAPDGERLLAHIDNERVELYNLEGEAESLVISGGLFSAPQWSPLGEQLVYAVGGATTQQLLLTDLEGEQLQELTGYRGRAAFSFSPDGERVAYIVTEDDLPAGTLGPLYVVETGSLRTREISDRPVLAFFWSPDGSKLAYLALEQVNGRVGMRWRVWDGESTREHASFFPSRVFLRDYLPYFDQYAQSHRIWSPDSTALVFAGTLANGDSGVWVQVDEEGVAPVSLGEGVSATWTPAARR